MTRMPRRHAILAGVAVAWAVLSGAVLPPLPVAAIGETETSPEEATPCPPPVVERPDATILAERIMQRRSDQLLLDLAARTDLEQELGRVLGLVRTAGPKVAEIHARELYSPSLVILGLAPPLMERVSGMPAGRCEESTQQRGPSAP